ncbi:MAG TPA: CocE/NonD family hydrolase [Puia sp.]|nr:CocE/NonD family hydrolase [Puia sp.]
MRFFFGILLGLQTFSSFGQGTAQDSAWVIENYYKIEQYISMRDGVRLFTSIYIPRDSTEKHPILISRTPYGCAPYGPQLFNPACWNSYLRYYLREGYIMVKQDVRGRWMSEGEFEDVRPFIKDKKSSKDIDESSDTYDAIDWLVKNLPGNNGRVGVFGISYPGFYSTMAAASAHPALKAVSPQAPVTDWFRGDDFHHNGAFFEMDGWSFYSGFGRPRPKPTTAEVAPFDYYTKDNYKFYLETGALKNLMKLSGDSIAFWKELYAHPNEDAWWKARNARVAMYDIKPAILVVGGLYDAEDCYGAWNLFKAIKQQSPQTNSRLVMGPWFHGQWSGNDGTRVGNVDFGSNTSFWYQNNIELPFFNYYLKGRGTPPNTAVATIFFSGEDQWRKFDVWPPAQKQDRSIYFQADGSLSGDKPLTKNSFSEYISDPAHPVPYTEDVHFNRTRNYMTDDQRFASRRPDVLSFRGPVLTEDLTLSGPVIADLRVSISATDADFVVKLIDVFPDTLSYNNVDIYAEKDPEVRYPMGGYEMLVHAEIMRGKYRNSYEKPEPFKPGKIETVHFAIPDIAHTFKKGHRLMIQVQSSWFPLADRNPQKFTNIYECDDKDFQKAVIRVYHDNDHASGIVLPVLK